MSYFIRNIISKPTVRRSLFLALSIFCSFLISSETFWGVFVHEVEVFLINSEGKYKGWYKKTLICYGETILSKVEEKEIMLSNCSR